MPFDPKLFGDHLLSLYQSIANTAVLNSPVGPSTGQVGTDNDFVKAVEQVCNFKAAGTTTLPIATPPGIDSGAWNSARIFFEAMEARLQGNTVLADQLQNEIKFGTNDPNWVETLEDYLVYFGPDGKRKAIPYVTPEAAGPYVITIPDDARIALIGDWGTGTEAAVALLKQVKAQNPNVLIHMGDIYYSGTEDECRQNFEAIVNTVFDRANVFLPVFNLAGNHDMYSGGQGYYDLLKRLNPDDKHQQKASFFCLRTENAKWQILGADTGVHDCDPFTAITARLTNGAAATYLNPDEENWHIARLAEKPDWDTIILSHHQVFSAFSAIGRRDTDSDSYPCVNKNLLGSLRKFQAAGTVAAWFWGHEHNLCIYEPYMGLAYGRCVGHGAVPVQVSDAPYGAIAGASSPPALIEATRLGMTGAVFAHGFAMITLNPAGGPAHVDYFDDSGVPQPRWSETIPSTGVPA
jgi:hypothetical protein